MRKSVVSSIIAVFCFISCTSNQNELFNECQKGNGEACNQFGKLQPANGQKTFFKKACDLGNTNGCVNYSQMASKEEALPALKFSCDKGNTRACALLAEKLTK